ncbi:MAG: histidinol dehydrogenase [Pseudomonadota bacterium]|jgi:histidinol dehydrogenase
MQIVNWQNLDPIEQRRILSRTQLQDNHELSILVKTIIENVRQNGDSALYEYLAKYDGVKLNSLLVNQEEYATTTTLSMEAQQAILAAIDNISAYHQSTIPQSFNLEHKHRKLGKIYRPIEKVGLYVPGGTAPLVSTLLMLAVPANLAGCQEKILVTPPNRDGTVSPAILFAAKACGIEQVYKLGGASAIAALAFGSESIPKTYKIFGPGNKYVTEAKLQVSQHCNGAAIDMPAGPSEVLVIADKDANPAFVASDLLAQAEHDSAAQVILVTTCLNLAKQVKQQLHQQSQQLSRNHIIQQALVKSTIIYTPDLATAFSISNQYAPEHLILQIANAETYLSMVHNAGSVFIGEWTPEAVGDYASGTNHVLPTYGYAKMYSGLDVSSFMKGISYQQLSAQGLQEIGATVECLASLEGLDAHRNAVSLRLAELKNKKF